MAPTIFAFRARKNFSSSIAFANAKKRPLNLYDCAKPLYIGSRICGSLPFTTHYNAHGEIESASVGVLDVIWFIGAITINVLSVYFIIASLHEQFFPFESLILRDGSRILSIFGIALTTLSIFMDMMNRNRLVKILQDLHTFDKNVSNSSGVIILSGTKIQFSFLLLFYRSKHMEFVLISSEKGVLLFGALFYWRWF